ncbi:uncharacterized protein LOC124896596 [Capsicum annuum]|uniref:uncharacterized protein LOC124896596 n=1 Tax=Capsicum annuum TaxID=4072 RepID=UPI001FB0B0E2|nr:uncharacterized protein LOC124896596 [Capsicum annuum]
MVRKMKPDLSLKVKEKVSKKFDANVIRVTKYPTWLANIVPVPKKDGKTRCQIYGDLFHVPLNELNVVSSPWPFASWGMDVIGPIEPTASNRHRVPESIIIDNGANLNSVLMHEIREKFKIIHRNSTPYLPQMNGVVEVSNKNIKRILQKMINNYKHWHENFPFSLLGYCTTIRTSAGATLYLLVYGTEAVLPAEVEIPSLRFIKEAKLSDAKWIQSRYEQLTLIGEKAMNTICYSQLYQNRIAKAFNKKEDRDNSNRDNWC